MRIYDVTNPFEGKLIHQVKLGDQANMVSTSWDGQRVYATTSLLSQWDKPGDQWLKAFAWEDGKLVPKFTTDFNAVGRAHIMNFGSKSPRSACARLLRLHARSPPSLAAGALGPAGATAHSTGPALPDEFIQGVFAPAFVPPPPGSYELPAIKRVGAFMLRDAAGRRGEHAVDHGGQDGGGELHLHRVPRTARLPAGQPRPAEISRPASRTKACAAASPSSRSASIPGATRRPRWRSTRGSTAPIPRLWRFMTARPGASLEDVLESYGQDRAPVYDERGRFTGRGTATCSRCSWWIRMASSATSTARASWSRTSWSTTSARLPSPSGRGQGEGAR